MKASYRNYQLYRKARQKFACHTYGLLGIWLLIGLVQWFIICVVDSVRELFEEVTIVCVFTFVFSIVIFYFFIYVEKLRFINGINFLICILIVELQVIALFALVARVYWPDLILFFVICVLLLCIFLFVSSLLPTRVDLTLDVAVLFISAFFCILGAIYILMYRFLITEKTDERFLSHGGAQFLAFEIIISLMILMFVMYHGQTINGSRFAEMRLNDYMLASVILFHDFLIIYWLTFYWQYNSRPFTPDKFIRSTTDTTTTSISTSTITGPTPTTTQNAEGGSTTQPAKTDVSSATTLEESSTAAASTTFGSGTDMSSADTTADNNGTTVEITEIFSDYDYEVYPNITKGSSSSDVYDDDTSTAALNGTTTAAIDGLTTAAMDGSTTEAMDEATTEAVDESTTAGIDVTITADTDETTIVAIDEATTVAIDETTTVAIDETTIVAIDETTITAGDETTTVAIDETDTVAVDETDTVTDDFETIEDLGSTTAISTFDTSTSI